MQNKKMKFSAEQKLWKNIHQNCYLNDIELL